MELTRAQALALLQKYNNSARNKHQISQFYKSYSISASEVWAISCHEGMINISPCFIQR